MQMENVFLSSQSDAEQVRLLRDGDHGAAEGERGGLSQGRARQVPLHQALRLHRRQDQSEHPLSGTVHRTAEAVPVH